MPPPDEPTPPAPPPPTPGCLHCGRTPTAEVELRAHTGMVLAARWSRFRGPLCKQCGLAEFRVRTDHTLRLGWWGLVAFFLNFYAIAKNLASWTRLRALHDPWGVPARPPPDPGRPVYLRPGILVPIALFALGSFVFRGGADKPTAEDVAGRCVNVMTDGLDLVDCAEIHDGRILAVVLRAESCPAGADDAVKLRSLPDGIACVDLDG